LLNLIVKVIFSAGQLLVNGLKEIYFDIPLKGLNMQNLTTFEMEAISGGYSWDFSSLGSAITSVVSNGFEAVASGLITGAAFAMYGSIIGGSQGGNGGGLLGVGAAGQGVGMIWGLVVGAIGGAIYGAMGGWDFALEQSSAGANGFFSGTFAPWS